MLELDLENDQQPTLPAVARLSREQTARRPRPAKHQSNLRPPNENEPKIQDMPFEPLNAMEENKWGDMQDPLNPI